MKLPSVCGYASLQLLAPDHASRSLRVKDDSPNTSLERTRER